MSRPNVKPIVTLSYQEMKNTAILKAYIKQHLIYGTQCVEEIGLLSEKYLFHDIEEYIRHRNIELSDGRLQSKIQDSRNI